MKTKMAFTLAEVIIVIGIIGIIAEMTLPTLISNVEKDQTVTKLKKIYTEMSQAVKMSEIENGSLDNWNYNLNAKDFYDTYMKKYLAKNSEIYLSDYGISYKNLNKSNCNESWCVDLGSYYLLLNNGQIIVFSNYKGGNYKAFCADINGYKNPNIVGKDFFCFTIQYPNGVVPYGYKNAFSYSTFGETYDRNMLLNGSYQSCNKAKNGLWCTALIVNDGWQIKDDYPW